MAGNTRSPQDDRQVRGYQPDRSSEGLTEARNTPVRRNEDVLPQGAGRAVSTVVT